MVHVSIFASPLRLYSNGFVKIAGVATLLCMSSLCCSPCCWLLSAASASPQADVPSARQVIHRRSKSLHDAILVACGHAVGEHKRQGALIVDVTPHVRKHAHLIQEALRALSDDDRGPKRWRVARLGGSFSPAVPPRSLAPLIPPLFHAKTTERNTFELLANTIKSLKRRDVSVVFIADWQFEDEYRLERFIKLMSDRRHRFGVVGSEAGFGRAWNDGVLDVRERLHNFDALKGNLGKGADMKAKSRYDATIGRAPFGPVTREAPWHGGDTAYPHIPYRYSAQLWKTEFSPRDLEFDSGEHERSRRRVRSEDMEDLLERRGRGPNITRASMGRAVALPSTFGPYGLMRAASMLGGKYVLWSWNPTGRSPLVYDFSRCDFFEPDLRSRSAIRASITRNALSRALLKAWHRIASKFDAVAEHTPPLSQGAGPASIDLLERSATQLPTMLRGPSDVRELVRRATQWQRATRDAQTILRTAVTRARADAKGPRRLLADAELALHTLHVIDFQLGESLAVARNIPRVAWKKEGTRVVVSPRPWILRGDDPENIEKVHGVTPHQEDRAAEIEAARARHLRRYRATPFGVQVAANPVNTYRLRVIEPRESKGERRFPGRGLAESDGKKRPRTPRPRARPDDTETEPSEPESEPGRPAPPPRGGSSGGGGPQTGGG